MVGRSHVLTSVPADGGRGVIVAESPFYPLDPFWPDQPGDVGYLQSDGLEMRVVDCVTGAARKSGGELLLGVDVPVRRGHPDWHWVVVHVVERSVPPGTEIRMLVETDRRRAFSAGHTASHLTALALNAALAGRWEAPAGTERDGLGHPDVAASGAVKSRIVLNGSVDTYRFPGLAAETLPDVAKDMEARLTAWIDSAAPVVVDAAGPDLGDRRVWRCALPDGTAARPCGGTHVNHLGELGRVAVTLEPAEAGDELLVEVRTS